MTARRASEFAPACEWKARVGMSARHAFAAAILLGLLAGPLSLAQAPKLPAPEPIGAPREQSSVLPALDPTPGSTALQAYAPDSWIYQQAPPPGANCCGPIGGHGPIGTEVYVRTGPSFTIARNDFGKSLHTGWEVMGGGKSLFFNPDGDQAWVIDLGLSYTYNDGYPKRDFALNNERVTIRNLHRTAVSLGLGHDWFLFGPGFVNPWCESNFRWGIDGGARWGTSHVDLNPESEQDGYRRRHSGYGAAYAAVHFDYEVPMGAWTFLAGLRGEWSYSFMHLLPEQSTKLHDINLLLTIGVRY
jgi:hypothetical protein